MKELEDEIWTLIHAAKEAARSEIVVHTADPMRVEAQRKLRRAKQRLMDYVAINYRPRTPIHHHGDE